MQPPTRFEESITIHGVEYALTGTVMTVPGHFSCIVKYGSGFVIIDGLKEALDFYPTFGGAVSQNKLNVNKGHTLS